MKRSSLLTVAAIALVATLAVSASATTFLGGAQELGATATPLVVPTCPPGITPANCKIVLTQVTALATIRDGVAYPTKATTPGQIVAFTIGLSRLSSSRATARSYIHGLDLAYGGTTRAGIAVLKPGPRRLWTVVAESPIYHLQPYLGHVVEFPLATPLPVLPGETIALTVPTWAPVLSFNLPLRKFAYRQSRESNCDNPASTSQAQTSIGSAARYLCNYPGTRVEYSATEIFTPPIPKDQIHSPDSHR